MKIAVCFSGMVRTGIQAFPSIERFIGDLWPHCDFFIHTWDLDYYNVLRGETLDHFAEHNKNLNLDIQKLNTIKNLYRIKKIEVDKYSAKTAELKLLFSNYIKNDNWYVPWLYSWHKSVILKKQYELETGIKYDCVVKLRPDVIFNKDLSLIDIIKSLGEHDFGINMVYNDSGVMITDDIVFVSNNHVAEKVSDWWIDWLVSGSHKDASISPFNHFYNFIKLRGCEPIDLDMRYLGSDYKLGLLRQECSMFDPVDEFDKCVECDRLHYHVYEKNEIKYISDVELDKMIKHTLELRKILPKNLR